MNNTNIKSSTKKIFALLLAVLLFAPMLCACTNQQTAQKLATPKKLYVEPTTYVVSWQAVESADYYELEINKKIFRVSQARFDGEQFLSESGKYQMRVRAVAVSDDFATGDFCDMITFDNMQKLSAPVLQFDEPTSTLSWQGDANAVSYTLFVNGTQFLVQNCNFDLLQSNLFDGALQSGENTFAVMCNATSNFLASDMSNQVTVSLQ